MEQQSIDKLVQKEDCPLPEEGIRLPSDPEIDEPKPYLYGDTPDGPENISPFFEAYMFGDLNPNPKPGIPSPPPKPLIQTYIQ